VAVFPQNEKSDNVLNVRDQRTFGYYEAEASVKRKKPNLKHFHALNIIVIKWKISILQIISHLKYFIY
jgi:hypothetical protein